MNVALPLVSEMVDVLNKSGHVAGSILFRHVFPSRLVAGKGLSQYIDEWTVAREKNSVLIRVTEHARGGNIEAGKRFASAGNPGHEANDLSVCGLCVFNQCIDAVCGAS